MAIKAVVDKLEDVPEQYRDLYAEKNGKFEITGIEGMKTDADVTRLSSALTKERAEHKQTKTTLTAWGEHKPEDVLPLLDRIPELEAAAAGKLDETKIAAIVEGRVNGKLAPVVRERDILKTSLAEKDQIIGAFQTKERTRTVHDAVRDAASKIQGFQASALEDALMLAERVFEVSEEGKVTVKDGVGATPGVEPSVWFTEMQQKRPHWWGPTAGGGAGGSGKGGGGGAENPWRADQWNMTKQGQLYRENPARAAQLAQSAGTTIGGKKPEAKK